MKKHYVGLTAILLIYMAVCLPASAFAQTNLEAVLAKKGTSTQEMGEVMTYYYKNPQPDRLIDGLRAMLSQGEFIADDVHFGPIAHMFSTLAHADPLFSERLIALKDKYSGMKRKVLEGIIDDAKNFISPSPNSAQDLDYLWAEFMATGEEGPVKKIIKVLGYPQKGMNIVLTGAAEWSLTSNAKQHSKVYSIIKEESVSATGQVKEKLLKILESVSGESRR